MTSELEPTQWQYWTEGRYWKDCTKEYAESLAKINVNVREINTRPAPAATDTGLVTVAENLARTIWGYFKGGPDAIAWFDNNKSLDGPTWLIEQCRSQAGDLSAAERARAAEKERLRFEGDLDKWMKIIGAGITGYQPEAYALMDLACQELVTLRADNAAKDARIKELETERDEALDDAKFAERIATKREIDANANVEALEAKLAAARKALEWYEEHVSNCRKIGSVGAPSRAKLDRDGGQKARAALEQ
ncbi:hypothetical protein [Ochrobactrum sp. A-1]|uniref:hypothetical protein n=1 Tax=Ochrobactrum sp. A-1 TaxID=2920940 RepID=UPI001F0AD660|nr:hypothetical protein [Ochrobactrum sp. A-1]